MCLWEEVTSLIDKKTVATALLAGALLASPVTAFAQGAQDGTLNEPGAPRDVNSSPNNGSAVGGTTDTADRALSWLWLLPLLAIPVLYFMVRGSEEREGYRQAGPLVGAKGGQTERRNEEEKEELL